MAKIKLNGDTSGYIEISAPAVSGNNTLELGPGTKILTNLDNTFTGVSTFTSGIDVTGGSVGIGTDNTGSNKLQVQGGSALYGNGGASAIWGDTSYLGALTFDGSAQPVIRTASSKALIFQVNQSTEALRITSAGSVAIGVNSPGDKLHVGGNNAFIRVDRPNGNPGLTLIYNSTNSTRADIDVTTGGDLRFATNNSTERLRIGSDGHLSYKNGSPPAWSTDSGYANVTLGSSAYFRTDTDVNSNFFTLGSNAYRSSSGWQHVNSGWATQLQQSANDGDLSYRSSSTSGSAGGTITWVEHFRATSAGNFGIGQNSPADRLVVQKANANGDVAARIKNNTTTDGSASTPSTASLYLTTSTGDFNTFYIQARRYDNDTHFGYSNPRDGGHTPNMIISNEGRVTVPNQPAFSVRRNGNQSIPHNTRTRVSWNAEIFDVGGNFDSSTNYRFTAPVAGKYLFMGHLYVYSTHQVEAFVYKNGASYKRFSGPLGTGSNDNPNGIDFMDIVDLSVNDFIEIHALHARTGDSSTVSIYGGNEKETSFVGYLLG